MILLRFFENQPFAAIGEVFQLSEDTARKRAERALDKLRSLLSRRGITSTTAALGMALSQQAVASTVVPAGLSTSVTAGALAGAASATTAASLFSLLTVGNLKGGAAALVCINLAVTAGAIALAHTVSQQKEAMALSSAQVVPGPARSELVGKIAETERLLGESRRHLRDTKAKLAAMLPSRPHAAPSTTAIRSGKVKLLLATDPEYVRLERQSMRAYVIRRYEDVFSEVKLSPEKLEALKEILVTHELGWQMGRNQALARGESTAPDQEKAALRGSTDAALPALLGDGGLEAFRETEKRTNGGGGHVGNDLLADLLDGGQSLTDVQDKRLARLLYDHVYRPAEARGATDGRNVEPQSTSGLTAAEAAVIAEMGQDFTQAQRELLASHFVFEHQRKAVEQLIAATLP